jgi:putative ABC transport system permease protein
VLKFIGISDAWRTVIGVVGNTKDGGLDAAPMPVMFLSFSQGDYPSGGFVIRARCAWRLARGWRHRFARG